VVERALGHGPIVPTTRHCLYTRHCLVRSPVT
jgi:hypothetical protein